MPPGAVWAGFTIRNRLGKWQAVLRSPHGEVAGGRALNPKKVAELQTAVVGNEVLVHDTRHEKVHVLNAIAARILDLCDGETAPATIAGRLSLEYGADPSVVDRDVEAMLAQFVSLRLLEPASP